MHRRRPWWLAGPLLAALSVGGYALATVAYGGGRTMPGPVEPAVVGVAALALVAGGVVTRRDIEPEAARYAALWGVAGGSLLAATSAVLISGDAVLDPQAAAQGVAVAAALGAVGGLYLGRARGRSVGATRTVAAQRDAFLFMNRMLRHHVLNGLNVIDGAAGMLADGTGTRAEHVDSIRSRSDAIARLVADARVVSDTLAGERVSVPTDVVPLVEQEVGALEARYPHATVSLDTPASATAAGGEFLAVVFEHLLSNAVVHNDGDAPRVWVTVRDRGRGIDVVVRDDGPGIDADAPFDPSRDPDGGFGLYLVNTLVTAAGGDVRVENDGGACVTVELRAG
ncbi:sensor histidine kinase [Halosegnis marinus]|uniref:histidine kinase n=1 Tax=Halosegnis marinus TaxID=3034023 RepID=A0ABD5ZRD1_9EURY|nr:HAMP domain-containing sensor histidine kinase [Halosegnis sp. DT85]